MRIDSHQHFWKYNPVRDSWITDDMRVIKKDFLPKDLEPILKNNKMDGCIAVQADQSEEETTFLLDNATKNTFIKGVVGWVDLCADNVEDKLRYFSKYKKLCGIRHIIQAEPKGFMLREDFQRGIDKLAQFDLTYDVLIYHDQLPKAIDFVKKFPQQPFVIDHIAKPAIGKKEIKNWAVGINEIANFPNVYCKISGMVTETTFNQWKKEDFHPYLDVITEAFGTDRLMFGSDWPVCLLSSNYSKVLDIIEGYFEKYTYQEKQKIMGTNAIDFYKIAIG